MTWGRCLHLINLGATRVLIKKQRLTFQPRTHHLSSSQGSIFHVCSDSLGCDHCRLSVETYVSENLQLTLSLKNMRTL